MSDAFVLSQWRYYGQHLSATPLRVRDFCRGLFHEYEGIARARGLIRYNPLTNRMEETRP